jgi:hypothetical protein
MSFFVFRLFSILVSGSVVGAFVCTAISVLCIAGSVFWLFRVYRERGVVALFIPIGLFVASLFVPGFSVLVALGCIGISIVFLLYNGIIYIFRSRTFALVIATLPILGAYFYVPSVLIGAGVELRVPARHEQLPPVKNVQSLAIAKALDQHFNNSAVVSYRIHDNRLFAEVAQGESVRTEALPVDSLVKTTLPWLEFDLTRLLQRELKPGQTVGEIVRTPVGSILTPLMGRLGNCGAVLIAGGVLQEMPHQPLLPTVPVFRASTLEPEKLKGIKRKPPHLEQNCARLR